MSVGDLPYAISLVIKWHGWMHVWSFLRQWSVGSCYKTLLVKLCLHEFVLFNRESSSAKVGEWRVPERAKDYQKNWLLGGEPWLFGMFLPPTVDGILLCQPRLAVAFPVKFFHIIWEFRWEHGHRSVLPDGVGHFSPGDLVVFKLAVWFDLSVFFFSFPESLLLYFLNMFFFWNVLWPFLWNLSVLSVLEHLSVSQLPQVIVIVFLIYFLKESTFYYWLKHTANLNTTRSPGWKCSTPSGRTDQWPCSHLNSQSCHVWLLQAQLRSSPGASLGFVPGFLTRFYPNPLRTRTILLLFLALESLECERTRCEAELSVWPMRKEERSGACYCSLCPPIRLIFTPVMYLCTTFKTFLLARDYFPEFSFALSLDFP